MALDVGYQHPRGTRAGLDALASANGLIQGQVYFITDENRLAVGLTASTYQLFEKQTPGTVTFIIDGGGINIVPNQQVQLPGFPFDATITGWFITADAAGDAVVSISKASYANFPTFTDISGTEIPTLTAEQKQQDLSLSSWTTTITQGDILKANVDSASGVKQLFVTLRYIKT